MAAKQPDRPHWGLAEAGLGFVAGIVLSGILAGIWLATHPSNDDLSLGGQGVATLGLWAALVGAALVASRRRGSGSLAADFGFRARPVDVPIGIAAGVAAHVVLVPVVAFVMRPLVGEPDVEGPNEELVNSAYGVGIVVLVLFVTVGAPIVEELFFRGLLLRSLERWVGTAGAVIASSVLFGLAHPQDLTPEGLVLVMVSLAALGALFAVLAVKAGRLAPSIVAHATFNAWTVFALLNR